ncbi:putative holin-like toxin [Halobacillus andaensis]
MISFSSLIITLIAVVVAIFSTKK